MDIKPCHKALQQMLIKSLNLAFVKGMDPQDSQDLQCNDTDSVKYKIHGKNQKISLYLICIDVQKIWNYSSKHFIKTYYPQIPVRLDKLKDQPAIQITIDNQTLTSFTKNFKDVAQSGIVTGKKKFDAIFAQLGRRLACIKRHFFASPFQMMLNVTKSNHEGKTNEILPNFCFYSKPERKQKIWLAFQKTQFTVYYGISFEDKLEQQFAKTYFSELMDAKKHVHGAPSVGIFQSQLSQLLVNAFPEQKKQKYSFTNGIISMTLFGSLVRSPQNMATYLAFFRTYAYYHIQASKCFLHAKTLKIIDYIDKNLKLSKIQVQ